jgi:hypothetical protein
MIFSALLLCVMLVNRSQIHDFISELLFPRHIYEFSIYPQRCIACYNVESAALRVIFMDIKRYYVVT